MINFFRNINSIKLEGKYIIVDYNPNDTGSETEEGCDSASEGGDFLNILLRNIKIFILGKTIKQRKILLLSLKEDLLQIEQEPLAEREKKVSLGLVWYIQTNSYYRNFSELIEKETVDDGIEILEEVRKEFT